MSQKVTTYEYSSLYRDSKPGQRVYPPSSPGFLRQSSTPVVFNFPPNGFSNAEMDRYNNNIVEKDVFAGCQTTIRRKQQRSSRSTAGTPPNLSPTTSKRSVINYSSSSTPSQSADYSGKMVIIGNSGVGKSSLLHEYMRCKDRASTQRVSRANTIRSSESSNDDQMTTSNTSSQSTSSSSATPAPAHVSPPPTTVGVAIHSIKVQIPGNTPTTVAFDVWDTAGQERFLALAPMYYRNAAAAMIVYDVTSRESFMAVQKWAENLLAITGHIDKQSSTMKSLILVGHKADNPTLEGDHDDKVLTSDRVVPFRDGARLAADLGAQFFETSVYRTDSIQDVWQMCAQEFAVRCATQSETENSNSTSGSNTALNTKPSNGKSSGFFSNSSRSSKDGWLSPTAESFRLDAGRTPHEKEWKVLLNKCCS